MQLLLPKLLKKLVLVLILSATLNIAFAQPVIKSVRPISGSTGKIITITGAGFNSSPDSNIVFFGPVNAKVVAASDSLLMVELPAGAMYQPVTVTQSKLTAYSIQSFLATYKGSGVITENSFAGKVDYTTGSYPREMVVNDLNKDGKPDIALINGNDSSISIFKNTSADGHISFSRIVDFKTGNNPIGIATGDLNGDGKQDLVVSNMDDNTISVYKNTGNDTRIAFASRLNFQTAYSPNAITISDFDGDGKSDIAVVNTNSNSISILKNTSTKNKISFADKVDFPVGDWPQGIHAGDINRDGKVDIAVTNYNDNTVSILKNISTKGNIAFFPKVDYPTGVGPWHPVITDVNKDRKPELIVPNSNSKSISVFKNKSTQQKIAFDIGKTFETGDLPLNISVGDIDGDAKPDLAISNFSIFTNAVSVLKNTGTPENISFSSKVDFATGNSPRGILMNDFDADGKPDMVVSNSNSNTLSVFKNQVASNLLAKKLWQEALFDDDQITSNTFSISNIYPNPVQSNFSATITSVEPTNVQIYITDVNGNVKKQWQQNLQNGNNSIQLNAGNLKPGSYFITVRSETASGEALFSKQ